MSTEEFQEIFHQMKDKVFRLSLRMVQDRPTAEDVVQEIMIKVWKNKEKIGQIQNPEGWIMVMTRNLSIDKIRSKHNQTGSIDHAYGIKTNDAQPDRQAETSDMMNRLNAAVQTLPEKQKIIFHLRDIEGLTYKEISATMEISLDEVKVNLHRARQKLRKQLKQVESYGLS